LFSFLFPRAGGGSFWVVWFALVAYQMLTQAQCAPLSPLSPTLTDCFPRFVLRPPVFFPSYRCFFSLAFALCSPFKKRFLVPSRLLTGFNRRIPFFSLSIFIPPLILPLLAETCSSGYQMRFIPPLLWGTNRFCAFSYPFPFALL